jgi:hypothetical protein
MSTWGEKIMSEFGEDRANNQVNESVLEQEFNLDTSEERTQELGQIREMRLQLNDAIDGQDPDDILYQNIERANTLLDSAQQTIERGGETNARLFEVCAQLINAITNAATSIATGGFNNQKHEYNMKMLEVKEKEVMVKHALAQDKITTGQTGGRKGTVVAMSREELLRILEDDAQEVQVNSAGDAEEEEPEST